MSNGSGSSSSGSGSSSSSGSGSSSSSGSGSSSSSGSESSSSSGGSVISSIANRAAAICAGAATVLAGLAVLAGSVVASPIIVGALTVAAVVYGVLSAVLWFVGQYAQDTMGTITTLPGGGTTGILGGPGPFDPGTGSGNGDGGDGGGGGCFSGDTPVLLGDGTFKPIELVQPGELVTSRDEETGKTTSQRVLHKSVHVGRPTLLLHLSNYEEIETTSVHRFFVVERGLTAAGALEPGFTLETRSGAAVRVVQVENHARSKVVYNLSVESFRTYFVGDGAVWVHNDKIIGPPPDQGSDEPGKTGPPQ